jgi:hypothetical protein
MNSRIEFERGARDRRMTKKKALFQAIFFILFVVLSLSAPKPEKFAAAAEIGLQESQPGLSQRPVPRPINQSRRYRGLVMADVNPKNAYKDEIIVDFGGLGLWVYEQMAWHQISSLNPDWILPVFLGGAPNTAIIADLGSSGLWRWRYSGYPGEWKQLSGSDAMWALALDDDGDGRQEIQVNFGAPAGVWRYDEDAEEDGSWAQISPVTPTGGLRTDLMPAGQEEGCYVFPKTGVWTIGWTGKEAGYDQLTGTEPGSDVYASAKFLGGPAEDLILSFADKGIWLCQNTDHAWYQIASESADRVREIQFGPEKCELLIDFTGSPGLYYWRFDGYPGKLTKLHHEDPDAGFCETLDPSGNMENRRGQELAIDFGENGLWKYAFRSRTWTMINTKNPEFMVSGDYWNEGSKATLAVDFGADGLWLYEGRFGNWFKISSNSPDDGSL